VCVFMGAKEKNLIILLNYFKIQYCSPAIYRTRNVTFPLPLPTANSSESTQRCYEIYCLLLPLSALETVHGTSPYIQFGSSNNTSFEFTELNLISSVIFLLSALDVGKEKNYVNPG